MNIYIYFRLTCLTSVSISEGSYKTFNTGITYEVNLTRLECALIPTCAFLWETGVPGEAALYVSVEPVA
jgi:hypothetical protein